MAKYKLPPRQKMINLLYIVLIAMLAINISTDVLNGYKVINETYDVTLSKEAGENDILVAQIREFYKENPGLPTTGLESTNAVDQQYKSLIHWIDSMKIEIIRYADGDKYEAGKIAKPEDMKTVPYLMLAPGKKGGATLRRSLDNFRETIVPIIDNEDRRDIVNEQLGTHNAKFKFGSDDQWEKNLFSSLPAAAAVTLLSKIEQDIHSGVNSAFHSVLSAIRDSLRVAHTYQTMINVPSHRIVKGGKFMAQVGLAIRDTFTCQAIVLDSGRWTIEKDGWITCDCDKPGKYTVSGYVLKSKGRGEPERLPFNETFQVIEPVAMVSPGLMNTLYAGVENPLDIVLSGIEKENVKLEIKNGTLTYKNGRWLAKPERRGKAVITIYSENGGDRQEIGQYHFKVKRLPDPVAYVNYRNDKGDLAQYWGVVPLSVKFLDNAESVGAQLPDKEIQAAFEVLEFETVFISQSGAFTERVAGNRFSERQREMLKQLKSGDRFYITSVIVSGQDGTRRQISSVDASVI